MLDFKKISLLDKEWMQNLFNMSDFQSEEYSFNFCYMWQEVLCYKAIQLDGYLLLKSQKDHGSYLYPAGSGDVVPAIEAMMQDAKDNGKEFYFHVVLAEQVKVLETLYPDKFVFEPLNDYFDYVYDAQSLITLSGKKLHSKRNHINRFKEDNPDWTYEVITQDNLPEVVLMSLEWCEQNNIEETSSGRDEACAVHRALESYFSLGLSGGLIRVNGKVVAFSMGEKLNSNTYLVHIEKAFGEIQGAYAIINQQFAMHNCEDFLYINREDDSGQIGLRKAKLSYRPVFQVEKFSAKLK